ncbi:MAG: hypothetical protein Q6363_008095 [Candidatus Njordarchaeota archaeon]
MKEKNKSDCIKIIVKLMLQQYQRGKREFIFKKFSRETLQAIESVLWHDHGIALKAVPTKKGGWSVKLYPRC